MPVWKALRNSVCASQQELPPQNPNRTPTCCRPSQVRFNFGCTRASARCLAELPSWGDDPNHRASPYATEIAPTPMLTHPRASAPPVLSRRVAPNVMPATPTATPTGAAHHVVLPVENNLELRPMNVSEAAPVIDEATAYPVVIQSSPPQSGDGFLGMPPYPGCTAWASATVMPFSSNQAASTGPITVSRANSTTRPLLNLSRTTSTMS